MTPDFFVAHINAVRRRIYVILTAFLVAFAGSFLFADAMIQWLRRPLADDLVFYAPAEALFAAIKISFFSGLLFTLPVMLYQMWKFFEPALLPHERHSILPYLGIASGLLVLGMIVCNTIILPLALQYLISQGTKLGMSAELAVGKYIDFNVKFLFVFGLAFQLPLIMTLVARTGLMTTRLYVEFRKHAILVFLVVGTVMTPTPDAFNLLLMAVPLILLYEVGIISVRLWGSAHRPRNVSGRTAGTGAESPQR